MIRKLDAVQGYKKTAHASRSPSPRSPAFLRPSAVPLSVQTKVDLAH
jgi:hypothetical protein